MLAPMTTQIVLVPGFWLGAWAWNDVTNGLRERGYDVAPLTLPGLEPDRDDRSQVTVEEQAEAIVAALDRSKDRRVLVVHSGAAVPGTVVLDREPELVDQVIYVDTAPVRDGYAMNADLEGDVLELSEVWDEEKEGGAMRDLTDEQLAELRAKAVPQPGRTVKEPVSLGNDARHGVPATLIATSYSSEDYRKYAAEGAGFLAALPDYPDLQFVDLPTGHWPMWSKPDQLVEAIAEIAG